MSAHADAQGNVRLVVGAETELLVDAVEDDDSVEEDEDEEDKFEDAVEEDNSIEEDGNENSVEDAVKGTVILLVDVAVAVVISSPASALDSKFLIKKPT